MKALDPQLLAKIEEIRGWMLDGDQKEVARLSRTDEPRVSKMLNKKITPSKRVLDAGIEVMNKNKVRFEIPGAHQMKAS